MPSSQQHFAPEQLAIRVPLYPLLHMCYTIREPAVADVAQARAMLLPASNNSSVLQRTCYADFVFSGHLCSAVADVTLYDNEVLRWELTA